MEVAKRKTGFSKKRLNRWVSFRALLFLTIGNLLSLSCSRENSETALLSNLLTSMARDNRLIVTGDYQPFMPGTLAGEANTNVSRYWNYRVRLREQFMTYGVADGDCIPVERIVSYFPGSSESSRAGYWGDATIKLGWYIGILATEIFMLRNPSLYGGFGDQTDLNNATKELYCSLIALERLDRFGEQRMWEVHPVSLNKLIGSEGYEWPDSPGFFVRDDVGAESGRALGFDFMQSDRVMAFDLNEPSESIRPAGQHNKEMSQDQVIHVLMGLSLVKRLVPGDIQYNGVGLKRYSQNQARKIMDWVSRGNEWLIKEPVTPKIQHFGPIPWFDPWHPADWDDLDVVQRGGDARPFSRGFVYADRFINDRTLPEPLLFDQVWHFLQSSAPAFQPIAQLNNSPADNLHMIMNLAAVGDGWGATTNHSLRQLASYEGFTLYPILNYVLHYSPGNLHPDLSRDARHILESAPYAGPEVGPDRPPALIAGWGSENRFIREAAQQNQPGDPYKEVKFNGLDYMLLHNLLYIAQPQFFASVQHFPRTPIPELPAPNWPVPPATEIPPLGYTSFGTPRGINIGRIDEAMQVDIFLNYTDPDGDTQKVFVGHDMPDVGYIEQDGSKFIFTGPIYGATTHRTSFNILLQNEQGLLNTINVPLEWPGKINHPPDVGAVTYLERIVVGGHVMGFPAWGTAEWNMTVYVVDKDDFPPSAGDFLVVGMENLLAYKTSMHTVKIITVWSILEPHGRGTVTIRGFDRFGSYQDKTFEVVW